MSAEQKYEFWLETADYDLITADAMFSTGRWLYVSFMCQQAIEKLVKGLHILYIDDNIPRIHDIYRVFARFEPQLPVPLDDTRRELFDRLSKFYLNGRYPQSKQRLSETLDKDISENLIKQTKEAYQWLLTLKP
ncbi:MAG: HEPN domain-containing protein [Oscillospiraceae bacterium]|nr:HEPN domain-containing protein [Oscillospiraceae bacterium]